MQNNVCLNRFGREKWLWRFSIPLDIIWDNVEWCSSEAGHPCCWPNAAFVSSPWPWSAFTNTGSHALIFGMQSESWLMGPKGFLNLGSWGLRSMGFCVCSGFCVLLCRGWASSRTWAVVFLPQECFLRPGSLMSSLLELEWCGWSLQVFTGRLLLLLRWLAFQPIPTFQFSFHSQIKREDGEAPLHTELPVPLHSSCQVSHPLWVLYCISYYSNLSTNGVHVPGVVLRFSLLFSVCTLPCSLRVGLMPFNSQDSAVSYVRGGPVQGEGPCWRPWIPVPVLLLSEHWKLPFPFRA